jgi:Tol biopolymer transport system component/aminoglycoside phosphotransferase (APT) family kinase protein
MAIPSGTRVGAYEVLGLLGAGGMGEVYRARDTKLKREVALKVLPDAFALDAERMARFTREAEMLASLNHINIAAIYGVEESEGRRALVLELVDGETLADRIAHRPMPIAEAMRIALQIAEALETAHERNIIHRDLKPANIKVNSQGIVKVLDFGLARALEDPQGPSVDPSQSPTISLAGTRAGVILGTAGYMAPEQARGKPADRRADIWAFGVVLFEMLTGRPAFPGETASDTLAKVLERDPDWERLPSRTPIALRSLVQRCVTKSVRDRLQAIGDARTTLQDVIANPATHSADAAATSPRWQKLLPWAVAPMCVAAGWLVKPAPAAPERPATRFDYSLPAGQYLGHQFRHGSELSPDGTRMVFIGSTGRGPTFREETRLYLKPLDQWNATPIPGTEGGVNPFFSPDGQWLGFGVRSVPAALAELKKVTLAGGAPVSLGKHRASFGITWGPHGTIVFGDTQGGLKMIRDVGGEPQAFTELNDAANEVSHRLPHFLPDGSGVLFTVLRHKEVTPNWKQAQIWVKSLKTGEQKLLVENGTDARYAGNGWVVFARLGSLFAVEFDVKTLSPRGSPVLVLEGVAHSTYSAGRETTTGAAQFSLSTSGALLYAPGSIDPPAESVLVWVDRKGTVTPVGTKPRAHLTARVSPDGSRVLFNEYSVNADVWVYDTVRGSETRQTLEGQNAFPIWAPPDGSRIAFRSDRSGPGRIYLKALNSPEVTALTPGPYDTPSSWTPDGRELAYVHATPQGRPDIYVVSADKPGSGRPLIATAFDDTYPEFSPDGRWLAYCSNESTRSEVWVRPYPGPGRPVVISNAGGTEPAWSRDGSEIFYRNGPQMVTVRVRVSGTEIIPERPVVLFSRLGGSAALVRSYDVASDGRFLMRRGDPEAGQERFREIFPSTLRVILNWTDEVRRRIGK